MQEDSFRLQQVRLASLPIVQRFIKALGLNELLVEAVGYEAHAEALETLVKSVILRPDALYRLRTWTANFDDHLVRKNLSDDMLARALDRLYKTDRASLLTKLSLAAVDKFGVNTDQIHNDSTSVKFSGEYANQNPKAVQLKRGHSKDHRPDLKQLVYSLSITRDGSIPIHFKSYDGNCTDDTTHWETWTSLRGLLGRSDFLYVADSKLCVAKTLQKIDREQGFFVTILPRTRTETEEFALEAQGSRVRWQEIYSQRSSRHRKIDHFEVALGLYQMREGYRLYWYRSSEKKNRDTQDREERIALARNRLLALNEVKRRGPKTEAAIGRAADKIINRLKVKDWLKVVVASEEVESFKQTRRGKANSSSLFKRSIHRVARVSVNDNFDGQALSAAMDGIFPLATNKDLTPLEALKAYKFQPRLEKRHSMFKSVLQVAPVFLKKNDRIEALMFVYFIAQLIASLIERTLRAEMAKAGIESLPLLPEGRPTKTPTTAHVIDNFRDRHRQYLFDGDRMIKTFAEPLSKEQMQVLKLLEVPVAEFK